MVQVQRGRAPGPDEAGPAQEHQGGSGGWVDLVGKGANFGQAGGQAPGHRGAGERHLEQLGLHHVRAVHGRERRGAPARRAHPGFLQARPAPVQQARRRVEQAGPLRLPARERTRRGGVAAHRGAPQGARRRPQRGRAQGHGQAAGLGGQRGARPGRGDGYRQMAGQVQEETVGQADGAGPLALAEGPVRRHAEQRVPRRVRQKRGRASGRRVARIARPPLLPGAAHPEERPEKSVQRDATRRAGVAGRGAAGR